MRSLDVRFRLVLSSLLMLFLELALIRWLGGNVLHLAYFSNIVLLASFLGIGLGFLRVKRTTKVPYYFPIALAGLTLMVLVAPLGVNRADSDLVFFTSIATKGPPAWVVLPVLFACVAFVMAGPGELVGACFTQLPRLEAYRWDLVGSLIGIGLFTAISFARAPSWVWGLIVIALIAILMGPKEPVVVALSGALLFALLLTESIVPGVSWSPYYKIQTAATQTKDYGTILTISANGVPHQSLYSLDARLKAEPLYAVPYQRRTAPDSTLHNVLIIGAGTGTDVALALRHNAQSVDAVEIDPRILQIGQQENPEHPYQDPRVHVHIDDGRAFLQQTKTKYDLIVFALPDSLELVAGASSLRLESYLFTEEALQRAHAILAPGGTFAMYNYYRDDWLVGRLANTVDQAFGHAPCIDLYKNTSAVIFAGLSTSDQDCAGSTATLASLNGPAPVHDNWPFVYLKHPSIPFLYLWVLLILGFMSLGAVRVVGGPLRRLRPYADLFLLGSAFLLLETRAVTGFALYFGTTWVVNAIVFAGVLIVVLAAVEVTRALKRPVPLIPAYFALLASLVLAWLVPASWYLTLPLPMRAVAAVGISFLPIFIANLIFASRFETTPEPTEAFAANLLGAILGGFLEYLALVIGYPGLLGLAGLLYIGALLLRPRARISVPA